MLSRPASSTCPCLPLCPLSFVEQRGAQMFPTLDAAQIATVRRFGGAARTFAPREIVYSIGQRDTPTFFVLEGCIETVRRDGFGHEADITAHRTGQFSGEISQLAGAPALAEGRAGPQGCTVIALPPGSCGAPDRQRRDRRSHHARLHPETGGAVQYGRRHPPDRPGG